MSMSLPYGLAWIGTNIKQASSSKFQVAPDATTEAHRYTMFQASLVVIASIVGGQAVPPHTPLGTSTIKRGASGAFVHPGVLVGPDQLAVVRAAVSSRQGPMYAAYLKALDSKFAQQSYVPHGPPRDGVIVCGSYDKPDFGCSNESTDTATAYLQALLWAVDGNPKFASNAIRILNLYATGLKQYGPYDGKE